jgi:hypothetical protein
MSELPIEVSDEETLVRAILTPAHEKKNRLKPAAFRSKGGTDQVSVMRHDYLGSDFCKRKALEISVNSQINSYIGLAAISAAAIRAAGSTVTDSRDEFWGHAHISHGIINPPPNEPLSAEDNERLMERLRKLVASASYFSDPAPSTDTWTGPSLKISAPTPRQE